eukprot:11157444-Lingulodinium_polyedra.AAC.1
MPLDPMQWRPRQRPQDTSLNVAAGFEYLWGCRWATRSSVATDRSQKWTLVTLGGFWSCPLHVIRGESMLRPGALE